MSKFWLFPPEVDILKLLSTHIQKSQNTGLFSINQAYVFMPTRRSCRLFEKAFFQNCEKKSTLLPTIMPIGDPSPDMIPLSIRSSILEKVTIPDEKSLIQQQIMATELLQSLPLFSSAPWHQCFSLAQDLLNFYEKITTQGIVPNTINMDTILPVSTHNQQQIQFLKIFLKQWPEILNEHSLIDRGSFRYKILLALANFWQTTPPKIPVFAILSAGWIPPVLNLIKTLTNVPTAQVWIHGAPTPAAKINILENLPETHPFFYLTNLCKQLQLSDTYLPVYPGVEKKATKSSVFLPAFLPKEKNIPPLPIQKYAAQSIALCECSTEEEEAQTIALSLRETLLEPTKTAALVTPNKGLAKRVQAHLQRWNISIDSSAGTPLNEKAFTQFCLQTLNLLEKNIDFFSLLNTLNAPFIKTKQHLSIDLLKEYRNCPKITSLELLLEKVQKKDAWLEALLLRDNFMKKKKSLPSGWITLYISWLETIVEEKFWEMEEACSFIESLKNLQCIEKKLDKHQFFQLLNEYISQQKFRSSQGDHPRLFILGLRESRLVHVDKLILSGLNEGSWPSSPEQNMWQYTHLQKELELPTDKTKIGYDGFDFWVGLSAANNVILTRSIKNTQGPTTPARWLNYLQLYFAKNNLVLKTLPHLKEALEALNSPPPTPATLKRPSIKIPSKNRPSKLSITQVEKFLKDPYLLYCQKILNLSPFIKPEDTLNTLDFGILVHAALEEYTMNMPHPPNKKSLFNILQKKLTEKFPYVFNNPFWKKRINRLVDWITPQLEIVQKNNTKIFPELWGEMTINRQLTLFGKIDRIDVSANGISIVDYKTGRLPTKKSVLEGASPQLSLSAILAKNHFQTMDFPFKKTTIDKVSYWSLHYKNPEIILFENEQLEKALKSTDKIIELLNACWLEQETLFEAPNICLDPLYEVLERQQEWKK